jgi:hypothetical protein
MGKDKIKIFFFFYYIVFIDAEWYFRIINIKISVFS